MKSEHHEAAAVSIGDVLSQLRDEFPDVTISKIRFLESQGLLVPDRTASGYRKFSGGDVERLRWILRQQKEHFLPLKVIKERLEEFDRAGAQPGDGTVARDAPALFDGAPVAAPEAEPVAEAPARKPSRKGSRSARTQPAASAETATAARAVVPTDPVNVLVVDDGPPDEILAASSGVNLTRTELARAAELSDDELVQLEEYGLVMPAHRSRDRVLFDEDALEVARIAAAFMRHGVEPRHLRMYRAFADREAGLFEQVLLPFRKRRNPAAQEKGEATLRELAHLGRGLRTALLRQAVRRSDAL
jgi:DNA-binding transcriptional MerR regulator